MEKPTLSKGINPYALSPTEKDQLTQELYQVHCQIFDGVDFQCFQSYVLAPQAERTRIYKCHAANHSLVGYMAVHDHLVHLNGRRLRILKTEVGLLPQYRGHNTALKIMFREGLRAWFQNRCRNLWFMATPVHPNPYYVTASQMKTMYPRPGENLPPHIEQLMQHLTEKMKLETPDPAYPLQRRVGWQVRSTYVSGKSSRKANHPLVQYYCSQNPNYQDGNGLMMLVPCYIPNALSTLKNLFRQARKKWFRKFKPSPKASLDHRNSLSCKEAKSSPITPSSLA